MSGTDLIFLLASLAASFFGSYFLTRNSVGLGSDHPAHIFIINNIKANGNKLFKTFPKIINTTYCGAMPMFLHWILAQMREESLTSVAKFLNPVVNLAITFSTFIFCFNVPVNFMPQGVFASVMSLAISLTPQFYHAFSARNFGISSRPLGLLLVSLFLMAHFLVYTNPTNIWLFALTIFFGYLAIAFNTFALQSMLTFSIVTLLLNGNWHIAVSTITAFVIFVFLHPNYGWSYIKHTFLFSKAYCTELSPLFILVRRYSIWRDFIWDFWKKLLNEPLKKSISYIYENSAVIVIFLNPFFLIGVLCFLFTDIRPENALVIYSNSIAITGFIVFILTSFRLTRFYGEPERYIEMVSIFGNISGIYYCFIFFGMEAMEYILVYCFLAILIQILISKKLASHLSQTSHHHSDIIKVINEDFKGEEVRFAANNEEVTKYVMTENWNFVRYWSFGNPLAGYSVSETFYKYPFIRMGIFEKIVEQYNVNACVIDKNLEGDFLPNSIPDNKKLKELYNHKNLIVYRII